jgi:hypothetical protein
MQPYFEGFTSYKEMGPNIFFIAQSRKMWSCFFTHLKLKNVKVGQGMWLQVDKTWNQWDWLVGHWPSWERKVEGKERNKSVRTIIPNEEIKVGIVVKYF